MSYKNNRCKRSPLIVANGEWNIGTGAGYLISKYNNTFKINIADGSNRANVTGVTAITDGKWHSIAMVVDRTTQTMTAYLDGAEAGHTSISGIGSVTSNLPLAIGQDNTLAYSKHIDGNIGEVRIWNEALTGTVIKSHAAAEVTNSHPDYSSLIGYWKCTDGSGNILHDSSPSGKDMTFGATTPTWTNSTADLDIVGTQAVVVGEDITGTFANFDGSTQYATVNNAAYDFGTNSFTMECKVKTAGYTGDPSIISNKDWGSGKNTGYIICANSNGNLKVNLGDGTNRIDIDGNALKDGNWHYISMVVDRDAKVVTVYQDGLFLAQKTIPDAFGSLTSGNPIAVGQDGTLAYGSFFNGSVSDIRIWNTALNTTAILENYNKVVTSSHPDYTHLIGYWKADDATGTNFADNSSTGANMTLVNTPTWQNSTALLVEQTTNPTIVPRMVDYAYTALTWMGVTINPAWQLDGRSWIPAGASPAPVKLVSFNGMYKNDYVLLKWHSANEVNLSHYQVQRSNDGQNFTNIGTEKADDAAQYAYQDNYLLSGNETYYRLACVDNDGTIQYSKVISIAPQLSKSSFRVYPNPASTYVKIEALGIKSNDIAKVKFTNVAGKVLINKEVKLASGVAQIDTTALSTGMYFVSLDVNGKLTTQKVFIK